MLVVKKGRGQRRNRRNRAPRYVLAGRRWCCQHCYTAAFVAAVRGPFFFRYRGDK